MSESKHTPGPWTVWNAKYDNVLIVKDVGPITVPLAQVDIQDEARGDPQAQSVRQANAHLIAAAPELLEALRDLAHEVDELGNSRLAPLVQRAVAAIAKATGEGR